MGTQQFFMNLLHLPMYNRQEVGSPMRLRIVEKAEIQRAQHSRKSPLSLHPALGTLAGVLVS